MAYKSASCLHESERSDPKRNATNVFTETAKLNFVSTHLPNQERTYKHCKNMSS